MSEIKDYIFKPVLKPDWFLFSTDIEVFDLEIEYYHSMSNIMKIVNSNKEDWEKLVELGFHDFNLNLMIHSDIIYDYRYDICENKKVAFMFDSLANQKLNANDFINHLVKLRDALDKELSKMAIKVANDIDMSGILFDVNDTNSNIHDFNKVVPIFYTKGNIYTFSYIFNDDFDFCITYSDVINFYGDDCEKKFINFVKNKSAFFDKASSMIVHVLPDYDIVHAAGLFYATFMFNSWINKSEEFNPRIIKEIIANIDKSDSCYAFSADM